VKTVAHLIATGFLVVPWLIAGTVVGGWLLLSIFVWSTQKAVIAVLYRYQVYAHIDAYVFVDIRRPDRASHRNRS